MVAPRGKSARFLVGSTIVEHRGGDMTLAADGGDSGRDHPVSLGHLPAGRWEFDDEVTNVFDDMLERSIPQYDTMRGLVFELGKEFVPENGMVVDLGCSRGGSLAPFVATFGDQAAYVGVEVSPPMLDACRKRFAREIAAGSVSLRDLDLRTGYPNVEATLTLSVLTLQFVPMEHRPRVVRDAYEHTAPGGAFVLVEKVLGNSGRTDQLMTRLYHGLKRANGYGDEEIERKRLSLEGVLVPAAAGWNEDLLVRAGFEEVECFWRCLNFAGWIGIKSPSR
jgi:tRNA (cmo5U34)-methyltransferase